VRGMLVTCHHCACKDEILEKARVAALEQQNTDLIAIAMKLVESQLHFHFKLEPIAVQQQMKFNDYDAVMQKQAAKQAMHAIERMLEDRKQFFQDYYLLKMTATPEYYREFMKNKL
jgi:hypothetical protein